MESVGPEALRRDWERTTLEIAACVAERPDGYSAEVIATMADLTAMLQATGRPPPVVMPGYWPTFQVWWEGAGVDNLWLEVFADLVEVYYRTERLFDVWEEPHAPGQPFTNEFLAAMPLPTEGGA